MMFLLFTPPGQAPDDPEHFYRAYQVSTGDWIATRNDDSVGGALPKDLTMINHMVGRGINGKQQHPKDVVKTLHRDRSSESQEAVFLQFPNMALNVPILYLPQALGISLGKVFDLSPIALNYSARLVNLLVWITLVFIAIKVMPMAKWLMVMVAMTPISLFLAASTSADALTYGLCLLYVAIVMDLGFGDKKPSTTSWVVLFALCGLVALSKVVYAPLILLVLLIPPDRFESKRHHFAYVVSCFIFGTVLALLWSASVLHLHVTVNPGNTANPSAQIDFIVSNPILYVSILCSTIINHFDYFARQIIGVLGWLDTPLPFWFYIVSFISIGLVSLCDQDPSVRLTLWSRFVLLLAFALGTVLIFTALYLRWNAVGSVVIDGVQGRYFIPLLLVFGLLFYRLRELKSRVVRQYIGPFVMIFCATTLTYVSWVLLNRYYIV